jgi:predicted dehydrogenase
VAALRWGVLSTAKIGRTKVITAMKKAERCEVVGIASRDTNRARQVAEELSIPRHYGSYEDLLADDESDAVYIPLPNHMHARWTTAAARAGKHVLCEKPLAMNADEAQEMADICVAEGVKLSEAFMYRLHPTWVAVRELVASGRIGDLQTVQSWFSYYNDDTSDIRNISEVGGGALYDIGCYNVNLSRMLFGTEPVRVEAFMERDASLGVDVLASGILEFERGVATFTCSTRAERDQRVHVYGTKGHISVGIPFNIPPDVPTKVYLTAGGDPPVNPDTQVLEFKPVDQYTIQAEAFSRAVLDDGPVPLPPEDSVANMRVIDKIFEIGER